jgi:hypothetical protein
MSEAVSKLQTEFDAECARLKKGPGGMCRFSENGPFGIQTIKPLVAAVVAQSKEIEELRAEIASLKKR